VSHPLLIAEGLRFTRHAQPILTDVGLSVGAGERVAVIGPSGSGKTTLLTLLAGVDRPDAGQVLLDGEPITGPTSRIALVLQGYGLLTLLTAAENVQVAVRAAGHLPASAPAAADRALGALALGDRAGHLVEELSGGQQQRVAVARALAVRPRVLLADEPTAEQDAAHRELVFRALIDGLDDGAALVVATHDPQIAERCDRVVELHHGRVSPRRTPAGRGG
jgi:putative ABC transport system ATP-binding protein